MVPTLYIQMRTYCMDYFWPTSHICQLYKFPLYCTVLYCTVLYCTVLYCTVSTPNRWLMWGEDCVVCMPGALVCLTLGTQFLFDNHFESGHTWKEDYSTFQPCFSPHRPSRPEWTVFHNSVCSQRFGDYQFITHSILASLCLWLVGMSQRLWQDDN